MKKQILFKFIMFFIFQYQIGTSQVVFYEDFGSQPVRTPSPYVPTSGSDTAFYTFATIQNDNNGENLNYNAINNGYYAVCRPEEIYNNLPSPLPAGYDWWVANPNASPGAMNGLGAVLVVNGGTILNQYYRRVTTIMPGKQYRLTAYIYANGQENVSTQFEIQNTISENLIASSGPLSYGTPANRWVPFTWTFEMPSDPCNNFPSQGVLVAVSLRNAMSATGGNDFYVDDILLEEVTLPVVDSDLVCNNFELECSNGASSVNLNSLYNNTLPDDVELVWFTTPNHQSGTEVANPENVTESGVYYAFFYDTLSNCYNTDFSTASVNVIILPQCPDANLQLVKTASLPAVLNAGEVIEYTFTLTNIGNTTVSDVEVNDPMLGGILSGPDSGDVNTNNLLDVGEVWIYTAPYTITQTDINTGSIINTATATGEDPNGYPVNDTSDTGTDPNGGSIPNPENEDSDNDGDPSDDPTVIILSSPGIAITKDGVYADTNNDGVTNVGDVINYTFVVTNTGNVPLTNVTVTDNNATVTGGPISLGVGQSDSTTFTAVHVITQADIDAGYVYNLATATGNPPTGDPVSNTSTDPTPCTTCPVDPTCPDCTIVPLDSNPSIAITKDGVYADTNNDGVTNVGDVINYTFVVTNTGNVPLTNVTVTDNNAVVTGGPISLGVGQSDNTTFTAVHVITQADIDAGYVYNLATATGNPPTGDPVSDTSTDPTPCATCPVDPTCPDCTIVPLDPNPSIAITKDGVYADTNNDGVINVGDVINYTFVVTNTGNVPLTNVTVTDNNATVSGGPISLGVGQSDNTTFTAVHVITQGDIDAGYVYNLATATGNPPTGDPVSDTSTDPTPCATCPVDPTCPDCTIVPLDQNPSIEITKDGVYVDSNNNGVTNVGDVINYTFVVTNTGNVPLTNVTVTDNNATVTGGPISLGVGQSDNTTFTAVHVITQADIDAGYIYNLATATGNPPTGDPVSDTSTDPTPCATCPVDPTCPDCTIVPLDQNPSISITKDGVYVDSNNNGVTNVGDVINYTFVVTNTGNVPLTNVTVTDNNATVTGGPISLGVGQSDNTTFTAVHVITQADIDAGYVYNLATATGNPPTGDPVSDTSTDPTPCTTCPVDPICPDCTIVPLDPNPSIAITKDGVYADTNNDGVTNVGDVINYTFVVTNTGNVPLTNVTVTDNNAVVTGGPISLGVGQSDNTTFTAVHVITQADIDAGYVYNLATATGNPPTGDPVSDTSTDPTPCATCPVDPICPDCTITPIINAVDDAFNNSVCDGGQIIGNVLANDLLGSNFVNTSVDAQVTFAVLAGSNPNISIAANGDITLQAGIEVGTYVYTYSICSNAIANLCDQATITIVVTQPAEPTPVNCWDEFEFDTATCTWNNIGTQPVQPIAGAVTQPTCTVATGSFVITNYNAAYTYAVTPSEGVVINGATVTAPSGTYQVAALDGTCSSETITVVVDVQPTGDIIEGGSAATCNKEEFSPIDLATLLPSGIPAGGTWVDVDGIGGLNGTIFSGLGIPVGDYTFQYEYNNGTGCNDIVDISITITEECAVSPCGNIIVHNAFTPNGDGVNEFFYIENIERTDCYVSNKVEVYNRWGVLVFETKNYDNNMRKFVGISEGRVTINKDEMLPDGTYFYIIEWTTATGERSSKADYLYLKR